MLRTSYANGGLRFNVLCLVTQQLDRARPTEYLQCIRPRCRAWHPVSRPLVALAGDMFTVSTVTRPDVFTDTPVQRGDVLIYLVTSEVQAGDFIALCWRGRVYAGFLEIEGGRWLLTDAEGEPMEGYFTPSTVTLIGRCVEVQRGRAALAVALTRPAPAERRAA